MPEETPRELFLIDGNSLVYRAFFALPESIATSRGFPTNAIFGFASMLVKLLTEYGPKPTLVAWDAGMSGRLETYEEYKAGRRERPDLLKEQWPHFHPLVDAFGYTNVRVEGFEADDVIATLAREAHEQGIDVMIVTGDRDLFQLVEDGVRVMATGRGITDTKVYDREAVLDRYGIPPELVPDFVGLKGDTSDNIPGVPGIGEKTATQLLQEYGDLEGVLANIDSISGRQAQGEPARARRGRADLEASSPPHSARSRWTWTWPSASRASPTARACARSSASSSCARRSSGSRRRSATDEAAPEERHEEVVQRSPRASVEVAELGLARRRARGRRGHAAGRGRRRAGACRRTPRTELEPDDDVAAEVALAEDEPAPRHAGSGHARLRRRRSAGR